MTTGEAIGAGWVICLASFIVLAILKEQIPVWRKERKRKKYEKLAQGIKKRTKTIRNKHELWKHSDKPLIIDGFTYARAGELSKSQRWHVNERLVQLIRKEDGMKLYLLLDESYLSSIVSLREDRLNGRYIRCKQFSVITEVY